MEVLALFAIVAMLVVIAISKVSGTGISKQSGARHKNTDIDRFIKESRQSLADTQSAIDKLRQDIVAEVEDVIYRDQPDTPAWHSDPATAFQLKKIGELMQEHGITFSISSGEMTKGQASDVIGLFEDPDAEELEILKFFRVTDLKNMNQTNARDKIRELFQDEPNVAAWKNRPAYKEERDALTFMGFKPPKGMTHIDSEAKLRELAKQDNERFEEWEMMRALSDDANEPETREIYECRKISWTQFRAAYDALRANVAEPDDIFEDEIIDKAIELYPKLQKQT